MRGGKRLKKRKREKEEERHRATKIQGGRNGETLTERDRKFVCEKERQGSRGKDRETER